MISQLSKQSSQTRRVMNYERDIFLLRSYLLRLLEIMVLSSVDNLVQEIPGSSVNFNDWHLSIFIFQSNLRENRKSNAQLERVQIRRTVSEYYRLYNWAEWKQIALYTESNDLGVIRAVSVKYMTVNLIKRMPYRLVWGSLVEWNEFVTILRVNRHFIKLKLNKIFFASTKVSQVRWHGAVDERKSA